MYVAVSIKLMAIVDLMHPRAFEHCLPNWGFAQELWTRQVATTQNLSMKESIVVLIVFNALKTIERESKGGLRQQEH